MQTPNQFITLEEAKQFLRENIDKGADCPCCMRLVKRYKYSLNSGSCRSLIILYRANKQSDGDWVHIQKYFASFGLNANGMNYILLKWWGLIEQQLKNDDKTKRASGYWRITDKGKLFVECGISLPKYVLIYDNRIFGKSKHLVDIKEVVNKKFDYEELMRG